MTAMCWPSARGRCWSIPPVAGDDKASLLRGQVLGGARVLKNRNLGLIIRDDEKSVFLSKQIGDALNRRFHTLRPRHPARRCHPQDRHLHRIADASRVTSRICRAYIRVSARWRSTRRRPSKSAGSSCSKSNCSTRSPAKRPPCGWKRSASRVSRFSKSGMKSSDPEVRFYSAEALAYLDDTSSAKPLGGGRPQRSRPSAPML